jgi:methionyl-tRNA formyltransferase
MVFFLLIKQKTFMNQHQKKNSNKMEQNLNFIFFGTPDVASGTLDLLKDAGYIPTMIVTSPDRPAGRGMHMFESPVSVWARTHNIPCLKPEKITKEFVDDLKKNPTDIFIVVAYGKILPEALIVLPRYGTLNIHYSLLPKYRGASPVEQALLNGDTVTGVTIQEMRFKLDSGPILAQQEESITLDDTKRSLRGRLITIGTNLLVEVLLKLPKDTIQKVIQDEHTATHCSKIKKEDGEIDPNGSARENYNKYRAYEGWPGVYFFVSHGEKRMRIKITKARYENDSFVIERVIPEGKKEMPYETYRASNTSK